MMVMVSASSSILTLVVEAAALISVSPQTAKAGETVTVTGSGFAKRKDGSLKFNGTNVARFKTDGTGAFSLQYMIAPSTSPGAHIVTAKVGSTSSSTQIEVQATGLYSYTQMSNPARTIASDTAGAWVATFTDGSYTVTLAGPQRTFAESTATYPVTHSTWVRVLPSPFTGVVDEAWLTAARADATPDLLAFAMQYIENALSIYDSTGLQIADDADYGPVQEDGTLQEGSDFNDYLGLPWTYGSTTDNPEALQIGSLDCSGYMRMIWGYRSGVPLSLDSIGSALPRRAVQMYASAPGVVTVPNQGTQVEDFSSLGVGDLVFFDASTDDGTDIDHVGMYLGLDTGGHHRFISSRKGINGPTLGDYKGRSTLNGTGLYATAFRAVRRL